MTQEILSSMDSDEVNSINDTTEAMQVARCIRQAYYDLIEDLDPPEHYSMFQLFDSGDDTKPTYMTIPSDIDSLLKVKYNIRGVGGTSDLWTDIPFMPMDEFLNQMYSLDSSDSATGTYTLTMDSDAIPVYYRNDRAPQFYTCFGDDETILFDAYDSAVESRLQKTKTIAYGKLAITFVLADGTIPDLDEPYFTRLLNEAKELAFAELKSVNHAIADRNAKRSRNRSQARKFKVKRESDFDQLPDFSRQGVRFRNYNFREK